MEVMDPSHAQNKKYIIKNIMFQYHTLLGTLILIRENKNILDIAITIKIYYSKKSLLG